jgi:hypothetical protein
MTFLLATRTHRKTYVHASDEDLKQGSQALAKIHRIG